MGKVIDADANGDFVEASLKGFMENGFISFIKRYKKLRLFDENLDTIEVEDSDGYEVIYEGAYNNETEEFNGEWEIRYDLMPLSTEKTIEEFCDGTWWMKKLKD